MHRYPLCLAFLASSCAGAEPRDTDADARLEVTQVTATETVAGETTASTSVGS